MTSSDLPLPASVCSAVAHTVSWPAGLGLVTVLAFMALAGLLAEWQRRRTLVALMKHAPGDTVIVQKRGRGGPAMWIMVGSGSQRRITSGGDK